MNLSEQIREKNAEIFAIQRQIQQLSKKLLVTQRQMAALADQVAIAEGIQDEADYYAELNRGYSQDRI